MRLAEFNYALRDLIDECVSNGHDLDEICHALKSEAFRVSLISSETREPIEQKVCGICGGLGLVCENHPKKKWSNRGCKCGQPVPCPLCSARRQRVTH